MRIHWTIWKEYFVDKIHRKHGITPEDMEQAFRSGPVFRRAEKGRVPGEDLYVAYGRTEAGRYVVVLFIFKKPDGALPISARDMTKAERRYYEKRRKRS